MSVSWQHHTGQTTPNPRAFTDQQTCTPYVKMELNYQGAYEDDNEEAHVHRRYYHQYGRGRGSVVQEATLTDVSAFGFSQSPCDQMSHPDMMVNASTLISSIRAGLR